MSPPHGVTRACAAAVAASAAGWALAQFPYLVPPDLPLRTAAAPAPVLHAMLLAVAAGSLILVPSFLYLFRLFKGEQAFRYTEE